MSNTYSVLFVCMGNICRSPTAHGVFRHKVQTQGLAERIRTDSAGTHDYHSGSPPDARAQLHAARRQYDLSDLRARQIRTSDFAHFDLLLAMDNDNLALMRTRCPPAHQGKLRRLTEFCLAHDAKEVPDPYYGDSSGFERVLDLVEDACDGLLQYVRQEISKSPARPT